MSEREAFQLQRQSTDSWFNGLQTLDWTRHTSALPWKPSDTFYPHKKSARFGLNFNFLM